MMICIKFFCNFDAIDVSSTLFANFIEIASMLMSGYDFLNNAKTNVESTPPLKAMDSFFDFNESIFP